ncbi:DUF1740-domain-containing protein [Glonium stellatum]|uniref:DUF1740-domain-containing protein n=1 Tax=Glonium stellatum TaxID=574774 RepID=A0A8E2EXQ7_9PEZI|nr:DUF1740-domain-containing protein [Glonium stellatum]
MDDSKRDRPTVPKFASFRPKVLPIAPKISTLKEDKQDYPHREERERHRSRHKESRNDGKSHSRRSRSRERKKHKHQRKHDTEPDYKEPPRAGSERGSIPPIIASWDEEKDYFVIDRKGDPGNITYGSLHRYSIPAYRRCGNGCVLGVPTNERIDRNVTTDREIFISDDRHFIRRERQLTSKRGIIKEPRTVRLIKPKDKDTHLDIQQNYIAIPSSRKRKRGSDFSSSSDENFVDYRSIESKPKLTNQPADPDMEYASDNSVDESEMGAVHFENEVRKKNALLSRRTKDEPRNLQAWLDLIDHQEAMVRLGNSSSAQTLSSSERRNLSDIRISMYEQAIREIGANKNHRAQLVLGLMDEGSRYWESKKLSKKWQETLKEYPENTNLWTKYLDFAQTNFVDFKYEGCRAIFRDCLEVLARAYADERNDTSRATLLDIQLYIVVRMTTMMKEAGYQEHALATWQALLEYHLLRPSSQIKLEENQELLNSFEEFWESEVPRIGEPDAAGWKQFFANEESAPPPTVIKLRQSVNYRKLFKDFRDLEVEHAHALKYPGRTADEAGEDDPFHLVLFLDIKDYISLLPQVVPAILLVQAFICFCHLPPLPNENNSNQQLWWLNPFLRDEFLENHLAQGSKSMLGEGHPVDYISQTSSSFESYPMKNYQTTAESLLTVAFSKAQCSTDVDFIRRALRHMALSVADDRVAEYLLGFEWHYFSTEARKTAKFLIKKSPSSLRLYNAYGLIEANAGNHSVSDHVFSTALGMSKKLPENAQRDDILLWHTWTWDALKRSDKVTAMHRLLCIGESNIAAQPAPDWQILDCTPTAILKAKTILQEGRDSALSTTQYTNAILYTMCLALLSYLQPGTDISAALSIFHQTTTLLTKRNLTQSTAAELNDQALARLLTYHVTHTHIFKPSLLRAELAESIARFPNNTILLSVYAANETRFRIDDRVRAIMRDTVLKDERGQSPTIVGWCFAIFAEMMRGEIAGSTAHSIRATFENAVRSDSVKNSSALWTSYVFFELSQPEQVSDVRSKGKAVPASGAQRAKQVFLRGLTHLPWCKNYMMLAFSHLIEVLSFEELRRVYNVMNEKELRVHVDLEDALEKIDAIRRRDQSYVEKSPVTGLNLPHDESSGGE